jgi:excisionase family DNA binding protein
MPLQTKECIPSSANNTEQGQAIHQLLFCDYPDVVTVDDLCRMLGGIGRKSAYALLREKKIIGVKIGRTYRIPKLNVIRYLELMT